MALIFESDANSRKSRRHGTSGRRRTTTSYDKYGYQIATVGASSSHSTGSESVMHVLRVRPGVVVNFIDVPSHSSRSSRSSRTSSHTIEHRSSRKNMRHHGTEGKKESSWEMTHSPHPRSLELFDEGSSSVPFSFREAEPPPQEPLPIVRRPLPPPPHPHFAPEIPFSFREAEPPPQEPLPIARRPLPPPPTPHFAPEKKYPPPPLEPFPTMRQSTPSPTTHFAPEPQYSSQKHESRRESSAPIDIPINSRSSDFFHQSPSTVSSTLDSSVHDHAVQPYYYAPRHPPAPIDIPAQVSSGRNLSRSFDHHYHGAHSSESSSPPSATRTVRFNENPVQPSPSPVVRRKGWWNRRGDQLWDNDGAYAPAPEHDKYPLDLHNYPEPGVGWMNEEGVKIDTKRRIMRKKPLRSALKKQPSSI